MRDRTGPLATARPSSWASWLWARIFGCGRAEQRVAVRGACRGGVSPCGYGPPPHGPGAARDPESAARGRKGARRRGEGRWAGRGGKGEWFPHQAFEAGTALKPRHAPQPITRLGSPEHGMCVSCGA